MAECIHPVDAVLFRMDVFKAAQQLVQTGPGATSATTEDVLAVADFLAADLTSPEVAGIPCPQDAA